MNFTNCLKKYVTRTDDNLKPLNNIANQGLDIGQSAKILRHGEYYGIEIEAVDKILPLFTTDRINKIYQMFIANDIQSLVSYASIEKEYIKYGENIIHYLLKKWCEKVHVDIPPGINNVELIENDLSNLNTRITTNISDTIIGKIKLIGVGSGEKTGEPILPIDWIGKIFKNGEDFHREMDKLPARLGKPPVTYCCTYGMIIQSKENKKINLNSIDNFFVIKKTQFGLKSKIINKKNIEEHNLILKSINNFKQFSFQNSHIFNGLILLENGIVEENINQNNFLTSYLCSLLQKCFRNEYVSNLLEKTIINLHYSKGYNLPDQHFAKVSGPKQLCWRSYISIIEDVNAYISSEKYIDLLDLLILSLLFNECPNLQLNKEILKQFVATMIKVQNFKTTSEWRNYEIHDQNNKNIIDSNSGNDRIKNSITIALNCVGMMQGDRKMLSKFYNFINNCTKLIDIDLYDQTKHELYYDDEIDTRTIAFDMHCHPLILIELQGSLPYIPDNETLQFLSSFIWENSSSFNTRYTRKKSYVNDKFKYILRSLYDIQYYHITSNNKIFKELTYFEVEKNWKIKNPKYTYIPSDLSPSFYIERNAFLLIFGRTYRLDKKINNKVHNVIICGNKHKITKVKLSSGKSNTIYVEGKDRFNAEKEFVNQFEKDGDFIDFKNLIPPTGWKWKSDLTGKQKLSIKLISSDEKKMENQLEFYVGKYKVNPFDGSSLLDKVEHYETIKTIPEHFYDLLNIALYVENGNIYETIMELHQISKQRYKNKDFQIYDVENMINIDKKILLYVRARIIMNTNGVITIGPCDRGGNKTNNSISYQYEGVIWRLLCVFSALYPETLKSNSMFNYTLNKSSFGYLHLTQMLDSLIKNVNHSSSVTQFNKNPILTTNLWDHQEKSIEKIVSGFLNGGRGFGDASGVGTGKTLVALGIMINLYEKSKNNSLKIPNKGFLVMLPTEMLYETWKDEIKKHTSNLKIVEQFSNGTLSDTIDESTIVITTMGRCRDHPLLYQWLLVVIDECLTVQNKEALQTEEAWRQSSYSYYGVLMLSATFFRARFDKMTYMLNMLNDTLPKTPEYIDTILSESIVCNLNENERKWTTNTSYFELTKNQQNTYSQILLKKDQIGPEKTYIELEKFIRENVDYIKLFEKTIQKVLKNNSNAKILIYANSKNEANDISAKINNVERFQIPLADSKKSHIVVSYAEGTFGLNNLTKYNTIITRPPEPDKLPQMKGRLDRPNQQSNNLHLEYIVLQNTIEEAGLIRLEICKNFYGNYIMPLAEWYNIALANK